MAKYFLYGEMLVKNDNTLNDFAQCVCEGVPVCDIDAKDEENYRDKFMEIVSIIIRDDISRTDIDYAELMHKYRFEIGGLLYDMDNNNYPQMEINFFIGAEESFNKLLFRYIDIHFDELVSVPRFV